MCVTSQLPQISVEVEIKRDEGNAHTLRLLVDHYQVRTSCLALPLSTSGGGGRRRKDRL